jgi:hypothetical protein
MASFVNRTNGAYSFASFSLVVDDGTANSALQIIATNPSYVGIAGWASAAGLSSGSRLTGGFIFNASAGGLKFQTGVVERMRIDANGLVGIGTTAPDSRLHVYLDDAATSTASQLLTLSHNTSETVGNGFGSRVLWELESSTTADQAAAALDVAWTEKTHASRTAKLAMSVVQSGTLYELLALGGSGAIFNETGEAWADFRVEGDTATHLFFVDASADAVGVGASAPGARFHVSQTSSDAGIRDIARITHNSTGTPGTGFGAAIALALEHDGAENIVAGRLAAAWASAAAGSYTGELVGLASDASGEREGWRVRATGSAPAIGFLGATPAARKTHVADPSGGSTVDAEARTAINAILATLETFGLHATS